ncbi:MAG: hypothetical protein JXA19_01755 [Anaerolineales bacterium]|nr:hypothetical protein [Anaerolineales bacterium]
MDLFSNNQSPIFNSAGTLGFYPDTYSGLEFNILGAFFTNPISMESRTPARLPRAVSYPGGILIHTGYPNSGILKIIKVYANRWASSPLPIVPHLLVNEPGETSDMIMALEGLENVVAVEIGLCSGISLDQALQITNAGIGELPILVRVPFMNLLPWSEKLLRIGAAVISMAPPRGIVPVKDRIISGRLFGASVFPQVASMARELGRYKIPFIASGGILSVDQAQLLLNSGAQAVQLDTVIWARGLAEFRSISAFCQKTNRY